MKKSRIIAAAMASIAIAGAFASCGKDEEEEEFKSENNANVCVYGPPSAFYDDTEESGDGQENYAESAPEDQASSQGE